jgi:outer membrane protein OmpA-like peptidoglycan-associated protein
MSFISTRRNASRAAAAVISSAALVAATIGTAAPASAAVSATVTVTAPAAVAPGQTFDVIVDVVCPNADYGTGAITADVSLGDANFGQSNDPNFETSNPALGTNPHHWAVTYTFAAPDQASLAATFPGATTVDLTTTVTGRPCVNGTTGIVKTNTILVADVPAAPSITSTTAGNGQANVMYTAVADPANAPVLRYEYSANGAAAVSIGLTNPFIATGLINEVSNTITVRAVNAAGAGPWSTASNVTPVGPPVSPTNLAVTPGNRHLAITFSAPPTPLNAIDAYQYSTDGGTTWSNTPTLSTAYDITTLSTDGATALTNGATYNVQVRAHNSLGYGRATSSVAGTPSTVPDAPAAVTITSLSGRIDASFTAPANGGSAITNYLYSTDGGLTFASAGTTTLPLSITATSDSSTPLVDGTTYGIVIEAVNANGNGAPSSLVYASPGVAPDQPILTAVPSALAIGVVASYATDGGITVTLAQCQLDGGASIDQVVVFADAASAIFTIPGLINGQSHSIVCRVGNSAGWSIWSDPITAAAADVPDAPVLNSVVPGDGSLTVNFTGGADNGSAITGYSVYEDGVVYHDPTSGASTFTSSPIVMSPLTNGTTPSITVTATNGVGESLTSNAISSKVGQTLVAVTASSPSNITYGASIPAVTWSTSPATTSADWTSVPTCAVYGSSDTSFTNPLAGVHSAGTYVTHCSGGSAVSYYPSNYVDGSLTIAKAAATNVITCPVSVTYTGSALTPCTSAVTGVGGLTTNATVNYASNTNAGTSTATANSTWPGDTNHNAATATQVTFSISKASSTNVITCPVSVAYSGSLLTPCTDAITGAGLSATSATIKYGANTNVGTATANSTWAGDANHTGSTATQVSFGITKAATTNVITCPLSVTYTGAALTPCTDVITGAGLTATSAAITYAANTNVGTATANSTWAGDTNHTGSTATPTSFDVTSATSSTVITCTDPVTFTGAALTPCHATVTGAGGLNTTTAVDYTTNVDAGTGHATASYAGDSNHSSSTAAPVTFTINVATSTTVITCPASVTYDTTAQEPCTAAITGVSGLSTTAPVAYTANTDAGTAHASASYAGDANHAASSGTRTFVINKAPSTTAITCANATYDGTAQTPCSAGVTGVGGLSTTANVNYTANTGAGTANATASFSGDSNHAASSDATTFTIAKAPSVTAVSCTPSVTYTGIAQTPCTASATGVGNLATTTAVTYTANTNAGTASAAATYAGDSNHTSSSDLQTTFTITKAASNTVVTCLSPVIATGNALTPCKAVVTGVGGLNQAVAIDYVGNVTAGQASASATFGGDGNHDTSTGTGSFTILAPSSVVRPVASWAAKAAARSYRTILTSAGTPTATLSSTTTSTCVIKNGVVYFLASGTCTIKVNQGGALWKALSTTVSVKNALVSPAKAQTLKTVVYATTSTALSPAAKAQLDAMIPSLKRARVVIVYGFASGARTVAAARGSQRAAAVTRYLRSKGVTVISSAGYGSSIPPKTKGSMDRVDIGMA